jgi:hypothetical protein
MATLAPSAEDERLAAAMQQFTRAALLAKIEKVPKIDFELLNGPVTFIVGF